MRMGNDVPVAVETVRTGARPEMAFVPNGHFHGQWRGHFRLASAIAQACAYVEGLKVVRFDKIRIRFAGRVVEMRASGQPGYAIERHLRRGIKQMIDAGGSFGAVAIKGFLLDITALAHFKVAIG